MARYRISLRVPRQQKARKAYLPVQLHPGIDQEVGGKFLVDSLAPFPVRIKMTSTAPVVTLQSLIPRPQAKSRFWFFVLFLMLFLQTEARADVVKPALIEISIHTTGKVHVDLRASIDGLLRRAGDVDVEPCGDLDQHSGTKLTRPSVSIST